MSIKLHCSRLLLLFSLSILGLDATAQDSIRTVVPAVVPGSLEAIVPPAGFIPAKQFNGYIHETTSTTLLISLITNANYINISKGMDDAFYKKNALEFISQEEIVTGSGLNGILYKTSFITNNIPVIRYILYAGDLNNTLWVNATFPQSVEKLVEKEVRKSLLTATLNPVQK